MGKGTIVNHIADGQYNVTLNIDDSRAQTTITQLEATILQLNTTITELYAIRNTAWIMYDSAKSKMNIIIDKYTQDLATKEQVVAAVADTNSKYRLYVEYDRAWWHAQMRQTALTKRKEYIENKLAENPEPTVQAWCADLTEDLSGNVGTIEIPNERTNDIQIRPGYGGEAVYDASRDGQLQQVVSSTAAGVYYNYAMFPGWQKWKPTYRVGKITAKPTDNTAHVLLDDAASSAQNLDVNVSNTLSDVPIVYMDCNGAVFEVDDRVVVEFVSQNHTNPRIIGFETNPKACLLDLISIPSGNPYAATNIHDELTGSIQQTCTPLGDPYKTHIWTGCTFDGTHFIAYDWSAKYVYIFNGYRLGDPICNAVNYWDLSAYFWRYGLAWTGTQLVTVTGIHFDQIDVFNISGGHAVTLDKSYVLTDFRIYGICWDFNTNNLIVGGYYGPGFPYSGRIRKYAGLTNSMIDEIIYPAVPGTIWSPRACDGLTMQGVNLITWGGRHAQIPAQNKTIRLHDGFSTTILQTEPYAPTQFNAIDMIVYPKNG